MIPVHDHAPLTRTCLDAVLEELDPGVQVIVADDRSTDGATDAVLAAWEGRIEVIRLDTQGGFGAACNAGVAACRSDLVVLLNNDTQPAPGWLEALTAYARTHPRAALVGTKLLWPDDTVQHAGVVIDRNGDARHVYAGFPATHPAVSHSRRFQVVTAAAVLVRKPVFDELGGFDPAFRNGWEDVDLCLRAGAAGHQVHFCADSILYHLESASRGRADADDEVNYSLFRNRWAERLAPDDLDTYVEDGLVTVGYDDHGVVLSVAPELGRALGATTEGLARLLAERTDHAQALRAENIRMMLSAHRRPGRWRQAIPRRGYAEGGTISVCVPISDHSRLDEIRAALELQTAPAGRFELVVERGDELPGGRAGALNRAIRRANGDLVLMLADDFIPEPGLIDAHLAAHDRDPGPELAAIGPAFFPESLRAEPLVRWLEDSGELFGVSFTAGEDDLPPGFFYVGNASLKRGFLLADELFDERLAEEAWDDYELGLRLFDRGMQTVYAPDARATHAHPVTLSERRAAIRASGRAAARLDRVYPAPHRWNTRTDAAEPLIDHRVAAWAARLRGDRETYYRRTLRREFVTGYREIAWAPRPASA